MLLASVGLPALGIVAAVIGIFVVPHFQPAAASATPGAQLGVVISADVRGYLEPCGCSEHMLGGLDRATAQVDAAKKELGAAVHIAAGDTLFAAPSADAAHGQQESAQGQDDLGRRRMMNTVALAVGPRDLPWVRRPSLR